MAPRGAQQRAGSTIKSATDIQAMFGAARRVSHPLIVGLIASTPEGRGRTGRVAFVAGKKMGNAVVRNRAKRVLREAVRRAGGPWPDIDLLLIARERTGSASPSELDSALRDLLKRGGVAP